MRRMSSSYYVYLKEIYEILTILLFFPGSLKILGLKDYIHEQLACKIFPFEKFGSTSQCLAEEVGWWFWGPSLSNFSLRIFRRAGIFTVKVYHMEGIFLTPLDLCNAIIHSCKCECSYSSRV